MKKEWALERLIALIMGIILLPIFLGNIYWGAMFNTWPTTQGRIVESFIKDHSFYYETVIKYEYEVDQRQYSTTRLMDSSNAHYELSRERATYIISCYSPNREVEVVYDPKNPQKATLSLYFGKSTIEGNINFFMFVFICALFFFASGAPWNGSGRGSPVTGSRYGASLIARDFSSKKREKF